MTNEIIHKRYLKNTLYANRSNVKRLTKLFMLISFVGALSFLVVLWKFTDAIWVIGGVLVVGISLGLSYEILKIYRTNKKIKQKLKT